jgi:hypothetical protein
LKFFDLGKANMKVARKIRLLSLLLVATLFVQNADATLLPHSSHYQGRSYFNNAGVTGHVDFAVYDTHTHPNELVGAGGRDGDIPWWDVANPDRFRYIYAYQVFVNNKSINIIDYFAILGISKTAIVKDPHTNKWPISSMNDNSLTPGAVSPDDNYIADSKDYGRMAVWKFTTTGFFGPLYAGERSWFLVLGSNYDWTSGGYTFDKTLANETRLNPEPTSITLFGIGGAMTFIRTRKKSCRT